jgi:hypothetical protein
MYMHLIVSMLYTYFDLFLHIGIYVIVMIIKPCIRREINDYVFTFKLVKMYPIVFVLLIFMSIYVLLLRSFGRVICRHSYELSIFMYMYM